MERGDERWRRLEVTFPPGLDTHRREQSFYFDERRFLRRHDYIAEVIGGWAHGGHLCAEHVEAGGLVFPTRRRVKPGRARQPGDAAADDGRARPLGDRGRNVSAKLYVILGSHACRAGILMLDHKGVVYEIATLPAGLHPFLVRLHGFPGNVTRVAGDKHPKSLALMNRLGTVPALRYGADRIQTNHEIARFLDRVRPDPPLFPADPERRSAVEEAERWGDEVLQMAARRLVSAAGMHGPDALIDRGSSGRLGPLLVRNEALRRWGAARVVRTTFAADLEAENELLASLPGMLDRIDAWIEGGS